MSIKQILSFLLIVSAFVSIKANDNDVITHEVDFDITIGGEPIGTIKMGLFGKMNPKTVKNFAEFAGPGYQGKKYEGSSFHRVIDRFMIQGGDMINHDGTGSISIYKGKKFDDEFPAHDHTVPGLLSMANSGPNSNGCQFFITTEATPWLDGKHVVFGKVLDKTSMEVLKTIEKTKTNQNDRPIKEVKIAKSTVRVLAPEKQYPSPLAIL